MSKKQTTTKSKARKAASAPTSDNQEQVAQELSMQPVAKPSTMRRGKIVARAVTYTLMAVATIAGVAVCIAWAMGYRFNIQNGEFSQVGLLQFNSYPTGATVEVNGETILQRTPTRTNIKTGQTTVKISLNGYRSWQKTVSVLPSSVRWLDYARLIPNNVRTSSVHTYSSVADMVASPDRKFAVVLVDDSKPTLQLVDLGDAANIKYTDITLDGAQLTAGEDSKYHIVEWDGGSRFIIMRHDYHEGDDTVTEYLRYDRQAKDTVNLSREFGVNMRLPHFSGNSGNIYYALINGDLRRLDLGSKSISTPLVTGLTSYVLYGNNRIAYIATATDGDRTQQLVGIYDDDKATVIKRYDSVDDNMQIGFARTNETDYLSVARDETVAIYPDPLKKGQGDHDMASTDTAYLSSPGGIDWLQVSDNGRFVLAGKGHKVVCYDVETSENYSYELERTGQPQWLDDYHILDVKDDAVSIVDFDGSNVQHIVSGHLPAFLSSDRNYMFSLDDASGGVTLQRSSLTTRD